MTVVNSSRATAQIDLGAVEHNIRTLKSIAGVPVMAVVKADGYGHGAVPVALAAKNAGAEWLGVCFIDEALELRSHGIPGPIVAWLLSDDDDYASALDQDIDLSVVSVAQMERIAELAQQRGIRARLHIEVDTGLNRAGASRDQWEKIFNRAVELSAHIEVISVWSHLAASDEPSHPANAKQHVRYESALALAQLLGLNVRIRHLANSAGALLHPDFRYDLVRCGIATYGITPGGDAGDIANFELQPVMTVKSKIAYVRQLEKGEGVSYSHKYVAEQATTVGLIPVGYADGIPRNATNAGHVTYKGARYPIVGTVCMDQFVVEFGATPVELGDEVTVFGAGAADAHEWALSAGTIGYELVTRLGSRISREYVDGVR
jgi:alanine racemase